MRRSSCRALERDTAKKESGAHTHTRTHAHARTHTHTHSLAHKQMNTCAELVSATDKYKQCALEIVRARSHTRARVRVGAHTHTHTNTHT